MHLGTHELESSELNRLPALSKWLGASPAVTRAIWALVRLAGSRTLDDAQRLELRELAWSFVYGERAPKGTDEVVIRLDGPDATLL